MTLQATKVKTSAEVRACIMDALRLDLIGPRPGYAPHTRYEDEILPLAPSQWYLAGFLVPSDAPPMERSDDDANDAMDELGELRESDDEGPPEPAAAQKAFFPSSVGLSVLVSAGVTRLVATVRWGDYRQIAVEGQSEQRSRPHWQRRPKETTVDLELPQDRSETPVPGSGGLVLAVAILPVEAPGLVPSGTRSVSVFLVNRRPPAPDAHRDLAFVFQARVSLQCPEPFVARPDARGQATDDWDDQVADLQYRDSFEFAVGHNVSAVAVRDDGGDCREVRTCWMPTADVEKVVPNEDIPGVELGLEALAAATSGDAVRDLVGPMVQAYGEWLEAQQGSLPPEPDRAKVGEALLQAAQRTRKRIEEGLQALDAPDVLEAFRLANRTVARAIRQRECHGRDDLTPSQVPVPRWRPFQLAFLLTNVTGVANPHHPDRQVVDLLFFPTGGGKTEAYLGLAAFTMALRRLRDPSVHSSGVSVVMRYTLRLLTLDQLGRAATLMCAMELERQADVEKLGRWPFEIGLWVGQSATPNRMGSKKEPDSRSARARTISFMNDPKRKPSPIPLENCPWCGTRFVKDSFQLLPDANEPTQLRVFCPRRECEFHPRRNARGLPVLAVDEPIYRRLPAFMIATVDKFANLPWVGETGGLFGKVERFDDEGFYGPCAPGRGRPLERPLPPPDLIIQDELHLISGPLGTMVGLYETVIDALCTVGSGSEAIRPKIVASTATVRRADRQIRALFGRPQVDVFPPPGPNRRDSFFALTVPPSERHPRMYLGISAQGRNIKVVLLRTMLGLLAAAQKEWDSAGGARNKKNPADPYMTVLSYFGSLRELGGARRIVEDEVRTRVADYAARRLRVGEKDGHYANRPRFSEPRELTSRESTNTVADTKRRLALPFHDDDRVDVALATNMISVGLDISRLGLMVVVGQPKMAAEYIQATSRVGRDDMRPGLVVTLLNAHRHRDRSHYERFCSWHECFYRAVEATSVTPFSPRAIDRGIAGLTVGLARLGLREMTAPRQAAEAPKHRQALEFVAEVASRRAEAHDGQLSAQEAERLRRQVKERVEDLLDSWVSIAKSRGELQYQRETGVAPPLLYDPLDPQLLNQPREARKFKAGRSLRDVEPTVNIWLSNPDGFTMEGTDA